MNERLLKRYHMCGASCLREQPNGSPGGLFVLHDDFVALTAKCAGLKQERDHLLGAVLLSKMAHEKAEACVAKLREVIRPLVDSLECKQEWYNMDEIAQIKAVLADTEE